MRHFFATALAFLVGIPTVLAAPEKLVLSGSGEIATKPCQGRDVVVNGSDSTLTLTGECRNVAVNGHANTVSVEAAARITVQGSDNTISYQRGLKGAKKPRISLRGHDNTALRASASASASPSPSPAAAPAPVVATPAPAPRRISIVDSETKVRRECGGADVDVVGSTNEVTLTGECGVITVNGNDNQVMVEAARAIEVTGNDNNVAWQRPLRQDPPRISKLGNDNIVARRR